MLFHVIAGVVWGRQSAIRDWAMDALVSRDGGGTRAFLFGALCPRFKNVAVAKRGGEAFDVWQSGTSL